MGTARLASYAHHVRPAGGSLARRVASDWRALVLGPEFHDGGLQDFVHGLDLRTLEFTIERADSYDFTSQGKRPPIYRLRFSRVPVFDLRQVLPEDWPWDSQWDPLGRAGRNLISWRWAEILSSEEVQSYRPPTGEYQGLRIYLHPWAELLIVFHDLRIELLGPAGKPWYQNRDGVG
jgi:hypothetical protein